MIIERKSFINNNASTLEKMKYDNNYYDSSSISLEKVGVKMAQGNSSKSTNSRRSCNTKSTNKRSNNSSSRSNSTKRSESRSKTTRK